VLPPQWDWTLPALLTLRKRWCRSCAPDVAAGENPGVVLGTILGVLGIRPRQDHHRGLTGIADFGAWLEQLLRNRPANMARGLSRWMPSRLGRRTSTRKNRVFVYMRLATEADVRKTRPWPRSSAPPPGGAHRRHERITSSGFFRWSSRTGRYGSILASIRSISRMLKPARTRPRTHTGYELSGGCRWKRPFSSGRPYLLPTKRTARWSRMHHACGMYRQTHFGRIREGDYCALLLIRTQRLHRDALQFRVLIPTTSGIAPAWLRPEIPSFEGTIKAARTPRSSDHLRRSADVEVRTEITPSGSSKRSGARRSRCLADATGVSAHHISADVAARVDGPQDAVRQALA